MPPERGVVFFQRLHNKSCSIGQTNARCQRLSKPSSIRSFGFGDTPDFKTISAKKINKIAPSSARIAEIFNSVIETELAAQSTSLTARIRGRQVPKGVVRVSGAKNSATRLLAATLLTEDTVVLTNFPTELVDARHKVRFLQKIGADVVVDEEAETVTVTAGNILTADLSAADDFPIRTTYLLTAGQIRANGHARIPYPGGCKIGSRGYDLHLMVWRDLGCTVTEHVDYIDVVGDGFKGGTINFPISTVGGTENALICASIASGQTEIINAYITPEIEDLIEMLRRMGAQIEVFGNSLVRVRGVSRLMGTRMAVQPDRIEALTWIVYGIMSGGEIRVDGVPFKDMEVPLIHIEKAGVDLFRNSTSAWVHPDCLKGRQVQPFELACGTHPGIISDMQPFYVLLGMVAAGTSRVFDYRYPERIAVVSELAKLCNDGAIEGTPGRITTHGPVQFKPGHVRSTDLRGSMALVLSALCAEGTSVVEDVHMALRGYNNLQRKLSGLGVELEIL